MKKIFFLIIFIASIKGSSVWSQNVSDTIRIKHFLGPVFIIRDGKPLKPKQLLNIMKNNPDAYHEMTIARRNHIIGSIMGSIGGGMFGWSLGTAIGGGKMNFPLLAAGCGMMCVSIPFSIMYSKHATKAVKSYNRSVLLNQ